MKTGREIQMIHLNFFWDISLLRNYSFLCIILLTPAKEKMALMELKCFPEEMFSVSDQTVSLIPPVAHAEKVTFFKSLVRTQPIIMHW
jgi:hypothetical protein